MKNAIDEIIRDLSKIELRDTLDCVVMNLLDTQNRIQETKEFMNNAMELKKKNREEFRRINNEMLEILHIEADVKKKISELKVKKVLNE